MQGQAQLLAMHEAQHMLKNLACTLLNSLPLKGYICKSVSLLEVCDSDSHTPGSGCVAEAPSVCRGLHKALPSQQAKLVMIR